MKKRTLLSVLLILIMVIPGLSSLAQDETSEITCPDGEANLVIAAGTVASELELLNQQLETYMQACPNVTINPLESPDLATERLQSYLQFLGGQSSAVDIYQIDVIWPRIMAEHMIDLYEYFPSDSETVTQHFDRIIENNTVDGRLIGMPWFTDAGLFFYRTDLLEEYDLDVPQTWDELEEAALTIQEGEREKGNSEFWGYVWQGNIGEPITINALEWQASNDGGVIISPEGEIQVNNTETIDAIERGASWVGWISPSTVIAHTPADSLNLFKSGNAAFMRNWPFAYASSNADDSAVAGLFDVGVLPAGQNGSRSAILGGWQLSVSKYSNYPDAAVAVVEYLTSAESQRLRALESGYNPTIETLYDDEDIVAASPLFSSLFDAFLNATPRPSTVSGSRYQDVSALYSDAVHRVLRGQVDARTAMEDLEFDLEDLVEEFDN